MSPRGSRLERERQRWRRAERHRPPDIVVPGPDQESVWHYPRPPRLEPVASRLRVEHGGRVVAETTRGLRVVETSSPPTYYFPPEDVRRELLEPAERTTFCEWKGLARYWSLRVSGAGGPGSAPAALLPDAAWSYPQPDAAYAQLRDHLAFFASRLDACWVGDARVTPQPGIYYGGWITPELTGPFKGEPGSEGW